MVSFRARLCQAVPAPTQVKDRDATPQNARARCRRAVHPAYRPRRKIARKPQSHRLACESVMGCARRCGRADRPRDRYGRCRALHGGFDGWWAAAQSHVPQSAAFACEETGSSAAPRALWACGREHAAMARLSHRRRHCRRQMRRRAHRGRGIFGDLARCDAPECASRLERKPRLRPRRGCGRDRRQSRRHERIRTQLRAEFPRQCLSLFENAIRGSKAFAVPNISNGSANSFRRSRESENGKSLFVVSRRAHAGRNLDAVEQQSFRGFSLHEISQRRHRSGHGREPHHDERGEGARARHSQIRNGYSCAVAPMRPISGMS